MNNEQLKLVKRDIKKKAKLSSGFKSKNGGIFVVFSSFLAYHFCSFMGEGEEWENLNKSVVGSKHQRNHFKFSKGKQEGYYQAFKQYLIADYNLSVTIKKIKNPNKTKNKLKYIIR